VDLDLGKLEPVVSALLTRDSAFLEAIPSEHPEVFIVATQIAFTQVVRDTLSGAHDAAITEASSTGPLRDGEGRIIPVWVIEAALRHALGELSAIEGITPDLVLDAQFAFAWSWIENHPLSAGHARRLSRNGVADFHEVVRVRRDAK
jgi:hypothetical protein